MSDLVSALDLLIRKGKVNPEDVKSERRRQRRRRRQDKEDEEVVAETVVKEEIQEIEEEDPDDALAAEPNPLRAEKSPKAEKGSVAHKCPVCGKMLASKGNVQLKNLLVSV